MMKLKIFNVGFCILLQVLCQGERWYLTIQRHIHELRLLFIVLMAEIEEAVECKHVKAATWNRNVGFGVICINCCHIHKKYH